jgi:VWFA-related protein
MVRGEAKGIVSQIGFAGRNTMRTLQNLFTAMADLPGRKIAVLLTETLVTAGGTSEDNSNMLAQVIDQARRSGVSVYALDAAGVRTNQTTASERITGTGLAIRSTDASTTFTDFENLGAARALVLGTGGDLIANTNAIAAGLQRAVEDSSSYYLIGFEPNTPLDNKFHRLAVTVKGKPDLVVRTRRGYLAVNQETVRGTNTELVAAMISPVPRIDLPVEVVANVVPKGGEQLVIAGLHVGRNYVSVPAADAASASISRTRRCARR